MREWTKIVALVALLLVGAPSAAQPKPAAKAAPSIAQRFPKTVAFTGAGTAGGRIHFAPATVAKYGITGDDVAGWAGRILAFHAGVWGGPADLAWDIYLVDQRLDNAGNQGSTTVSPDRKVAGAASPGPHACVTLLTLGNIPGFLGDNDQRFSSQAEYVLAHEAAHCFQRTAGTPQNETVAYDHASWFMEGSASWLAGDYFESVGRDYPSYFEVELRKRHKRSMLTYFNGNHYFFKWLSGKQGLKSRGAVIEFVRAMMNVPPSGCVTRLPVEVLPEERGPITQVPCKDPSPYVKALPGWFADKNISIAKVLSLFASALVRGDVPGLRAPNLLFGNVEFGVDPGFNVARMAPGLAGIPLPAPLGNLLAAMTLDEPMERPTTEQVVGELRMMAREAGMDAPVDARGLR